MVAVAEATGGEAYFNTNDLRGAVTKAIDNGANYYTISYAPPSPAFDGRYHAIGIKVDRPKVKLAYRRGYNADDIGNNAIMPGLTLSTTDAGAVELDLDGQAIGVAGGVQQSAENIPLDPQAIVDRFHR